MLLEPSPTASTLPELKQAAVYSFVKEGKLWYIDLPEYLQSGGSKSDLLMVEGADAFLNFMANGRQAVAVQLDTLPFDGADVLELEELGKAPKGGGYYRLHCFEQGNFKKRIWLCDIALYVFGDMPERIYIKKYRHAA